MDPALSQAQALTLVVASAVVAIVVIAAPLRVALVAAIAVAVGFVAWVQAAAPAVTSSLLLALAVLAGVVVRQRRQQADARERRLEEELALADARRETALLEERTRLAREIHDVLAHALAGLTLQLERTRLLAEQHGDTEVAAQLQRSHAAAARGLDEARAAVGVLRGEQAVDTEAMRALTTSVADAAGVPVRFAVTGDPVGLDAERQLVLYRSLQEALTNAVRHASPASIDVALTHRPDEVVLTVENDGVAPAGDGDDGGRGGGWGLQGLRERCALVDGLLSAGPTPAGDRFRVEVVLPRSAER